MPVFLSFSTLLLVPAATTPPAPSHRRLYRLSSLSQRMRTSGDAAASYRALRGARHALWNERATILPEKLRTRETDAICSPTISLLSSPLLPSPLLSTYLSTWSSVSQFVIWRLDSSEYFIELVIASTSRDDGNIFSLFSNTVLHDPRARRIDFHQSTCITYPCSIHIYYVRSKETTLQNSKL